MLQPWPVISTNEDDIDQMHVVYDAIIKMSYVCLSNLLKFTLVG